MKAEFFILGALHRGDLHPYEIKRRLHNALVECYTDVDVGTLYYAVRQLTKSGDIAAKASQRVARGGQRTIYCLTSQGRKRFQELLLKQFREDGTVAQTIYPALLFLQVAPIARGRSNRKNRGAPCRGNQAAFVPGGGREPTRLAVTSYAISSPDSASALDNRFGGLRSPATARRRLLHRG